MPDLIVSSDIDLLMQQPTKAAVVDFLGLGPSANPAFNSLNIVGGLNVGGAITGLSLYAPTIVGDTLSIAGYSGLGALGVVGQTTLGNLNVGGPAMFASSVLLAQTLAVSGAVALANTLGVAGLSTLAALTATSLMVSGPSGFTGAVTVVDIAGTGTTSFAELDVSGNADVSGTFEVDGVFTLNSNMFINNGSFSGVELSADPSDPSEGHYVLWQSDGTGSGDDGDIMIKITAGAVTKTGTLVDFSTL
jgi:hypothetical protein